MVRLDHSASVHGNIGALENTEGTKAVKGQGGTAQPTTGGVAQGPARDAASVSLAGNAVAQASAGSDVRSDKVAALQAAIANGTYNVPAGAVADKLIQSLLGGQ